METIALKYTGTLMFVELVYGTITFGKYKLWRTMAKLSIDKRLLFVKADLDRCKHLRTCYINSGIGKKICLLINVQ